MLSSVILLYLLAIFFHMHVLEAPQRIPKELKDNKSLFLAGGITNCPDWQSNLIQLLEKYETTEDLLVFNPRRATPLPEQHAHEQIKWEYERLHDADVISFWFSAGSLNPITLYELGMWGNSRDRRVCIGIDPDYEREFDVVWQTFLARPEINIVYSLSDLAQEINLMLEEIS